MATARSPRRLWPAAVLAALLAGCNDRLTVPDTNDPDRVRILATFADLETVTAGAFRTVYNSSIGGVSSNLGLHLRLLGAEQVVGNASAQGWNYGVPRSPAPNQRSAASVSIGSFRNLSYAARQAADGLNRMYLAGITSGSAAQDARLKAFAWFTLGMAHAHLALTFDSAAVLDPRAELTFVPDLTGYREAMATALADLDSALAWTAVAAAASGANGFPLPNTWVNGVAPTAAQFGQLVRSYKAAFRADVARNPTEGAAVRWDSVLLDAAAGITADFLVTTQATPQWTVGAMSGVISGGLNNQSYQLYAGMADTSGGFSIWLQAPYESKVPFLVVTPDRRFPQGTTRATQRTNSPTVPTGVLYFRNRSTTDNPAPDAYGTSWYEWYRFYPWAASASGGPYTAFTLNHNDMLRAEALLRTGNIPAAAALIDVYRARAGLPALSGVITALGQPVPGGTATAPVPGGASCVPRIPVGTAPTWTGSTCGDIWEAMKWEYRMENMFVGYAAWYLPARRWNDLPEGTARHLPVPWEEMDARVRPFYQLGGVGGPDAVVGKGTYGM